MDDAGKYWLQHHEEAAALVDGRIAPLRSLTFDEAGALPEEQGEQVVVMGLERLLTTSRRHLDSNAILVRIDLAPAAWLGIGSVPVRRGFMLNRDGSVREVSEFELGLL